MVLLKTTTRKCTFFVIVVSKVTCVEFLTYMNTDLLSLSLYLFLCISLSVSLCISLYRWRDDDRIRHRFHWSDDCGRHCDGCELHGYCGTCSQSPLPKRTLFWNRKAVDIIGVQRERWLRCRWMYLWCAVWRKPLWNLSLPRQQRLLEQWRLH